MYDIITKMQVIRKFSIRKKHLITFIWDRYWADADIIFYSRDWCDCVLFIRLLLSWHCFLKLNFFIKSLLIFLGWLFSITFAELGNITTPNLKWPDLLSRWMAECGKQAAVSSGPVCEGRQDLGEAHLQDLDMWSTVSFWASQSLAPQLALLHETLILQFNVAMNHNHT